jgi:2-isopropylmalate synthase
MYELLSFQVVTNDLYPTAIVELKKGDEILKGSAVGDGPIDALYSVIKTLAGMEVSLTHYKINSISRGKEAVGRVNVQIEHKSKIYSGRAMDTDIIKASALAFLNGMNAVLLDTVHNRENECV